MDYFIELSIFGLFVVSGWIVYEKADKPGWGFLIPFYDLYLFLDIAGRVNWFIQLLIGPIVVIILGVIIIFKIDPLLGYLIMIVLSIYFLIIGFIAAFDFSASFGKTKLFGVGIIFLPFIFFPILALDGSKYKYKKNFQETIKEMPLKQITELSLNENLIGLIAHDAKSKIYLGKIYKIDQSNKKCIIMTDFREEIIKSFDEILVRDKS